MIARLRIRRPRLVMLGVALGCLPAAWIGLPAGDSPEAGEIEEAFSRQARRIGSLEVSYSLATKSDLEPSALLSLPEFRNQLFLPQDEWTEAFDGPKRYRRHVQAERVDYLDEPDEFGLVPPRDPEPDDPPAIQEQQRALRKEYDRAAAAMRAQQARGVPARPREEAEVVPLSERDVTRAFNGRTVWMRHPIDAEQNEVQVWPMEPKALHFFGMSSYLSAVGLQPADPTAKGSQALRAQEMFRLADWFRTHDHALEKAETIDGSTGVVLKGSLNGVYAPSVISGDLIDRIWLDRDHGWAVRRREQSRDGRLVARWENSELREVEPGLWLPMVVRHDRFAEDAPADRRDERAITEEVRVKRIEVNRVPSERFDLVPTKSDLVEDLRGRF